MKAIKRKFSISSILMGTTYNNISNILQYNDSLLLDEKCETPWSLADESDVMNEVDYLYGNKFILSRLKYKTKYSLNRLISIRQEHTRTLKS